MTRVTNRDEKVIRRIGDLGIVELPFEFIREGERTRVIEGLVGIVGEIQLEVRVWYDTQVGNARKACIVFYQ